jgi:hypothetical protein
MRWNYYHPLFYLFVSVFFSLLLSEIIVLRLGFTRHKPPYESILHEDWLYMFDAERGWKNRPGSYRLSKLDGDLVHTITILADGSRKAHNGLIKTEDAPIVMIGDSFIHGFGLDDDKTIAWRLQRRVENREVVNLGVNGYSNWQAFLTLKEIQKKTKQNTYFIHGFIPDHLARNVVTPHWVNVSNRMISINNQFFPFVRVQDNGSVITGKAQLPSFPFSSKVALIHLVEQVYSNLNYRVSEEVKWQSLAYALKKMNEQILADKSKLLLVLLGDSTEMEPFRPLFKKLDLTILDCTIASQDIAKYLLKSDPHPNAAYADLLAERIAHFIKADTKK